MFKTVVLFNITLIYFLWLFDESSKEQYLFEIGILCNIINVTFFIKSFMLNNKKKKTYWPQTFEWKFIYIYIYIYMCLNILMCNKIIYAFHLLSPDKDQAIISSWQEETVWGNSFTFGGLWAGLADKQHFCLKMIRLGKQTYYRARISVSIASQYHMSNNSFICSVWGCRLHPYIHRADKRSGDRIGNTEWMGHCLSWLNESDSLPGYK